MRFCCGYSTTGVLHAALPQISIFAVLPQYKDRIKMHLTTLTFSHFEFFAKIMCEYLESLQEISENSHL